MSNSRRGRGIPMISGPRYPWAKDPKPKRKRGGVGVRMTALARLVNYEKANNGRPLTPAQTRRIRLKAKGEA